MQAFPFDSELTYDEHDNPIYDRAVSSQPLRKLIKELFTTGVMPNPSTNFQVSAGNDGMTVQVAGGFAVIDGGLCHETEVRTLEVTAADNTYDRIDTVVLRWNENVDVRTADLYVVAGTPAVNPVRPTLQRNNSVYEIGLADVFITKRVATITTDKITDTRYEASRCGIVSSISQFDTTTLYQQVQEDLAHFQGHEEQDFLNWLDHIHDMLDQDTAGNLQNQIDTLDTNVGIHESTIAQLNSDLTANTKKFKFAYDSVKQKYGYTIDGTFHPFSTGTIYLGEYSAKTTIDISAYGATSTNQFLAMPARGLTVQPNPSNSSQDGTYGMGWVRGEAVYVPPSISLSGNILTLNPATLTNSGSAIGVSAWSNTQTLATKLYYVGDIE